MPAIRPLFSERLRTDWRSPVRAAGCRASIAKALHEDESGVWSGGRVVPMAEVAYPPSDREISALADYLARL
jgi:hypothetical protein